MPKQGKTLYDLMRESDNKEEDACFPEEWEEERAKSSKEKYFEYYDDIKLTPKDDWWLKSKKDMLNCISFFIMNI